MTFKDQIAADVNNIMLNTDEFAEQIVYVTKCGIEKSVNAVIDRPRANSGSEDHGRINRKTAVVFISNDPTLGMASIDPRGDKVLFKQHPNDSAAVEWAVLQILESDIASWSLEVTR